MKTIYSHALPATAGKKAIRNEGLSFGRPFFVQKSSDAQEKEV